jgi:hypothetical protein
MSWSEYAKSAIPNRMMLIECLGKTENSDHISWIDVHTKSAGIRFLNIFSIISFFVASLRELSGLPGSVKWN